METPRIIYTIGTSDRTLEEFLGLLRVFHIAELIDVRRFPSSKRYPWFDRTSLEQALRAEGFGYRWLGEALGGFREEGYRAYMTKLSYLQGLEMVERTAVTSVTALVCAERLPWKCHRLQIARSLEERGWEVLHILIRRPYLAAAAGILEIRK
ncbi:MAG: DUF488 domain-containing protein [Deltaproteobacteria bacterium]|nr:DUF488 domain-containing protein [Deltaproteobacteria bacterium]